MAASCDIRRRTLLSVLAGACGGLVFAGLSRALRRCSRLSAPPLRPPGALPGDEFLTSCVRCGACIRACPEGLLRDGAAVGDPASALVPVAEFAHGRRCAISCTACADACPAGAIRLR